jgi:hypothetical protein
MQDDKLPSGSLSRHYDAVIGSLPKGLSQDERLRIRQSAPMSPALGTLSEMPLVCSQLQLMQLPMHYPALNQQHLPSLAAVVAATWMWFQQVSFISWMILSITLHKRVKQPSVVIATHLLVQPHTTPVSAVIMPAMSWPTCCCSIT